MPEITQPANKRAGEVDALKGLAILGVLALHSLPIDFFQKSMAIFHLWQSVPIFILLMGYNGSRSRYVSKDSLASAYSKSYFLSRVYRILLPLVVILLIDILIGVVNGRLAFSPLLIVGVLPFTGPGNYYITIILQFILLFPALEYFYKRSPHAVFYMSLIVAAVYEFFGRFLLTEQPYIYEACIFRYLPLIVLGICVSRKELRKSTLYLCVFSTLYTISILLVHLGYPSGAEGVRAQTFLAAGYTTSLVVLGLYVLGGLEKKDYSKYFIRVLQYVGSLSYEVFLAQIIFFALLPKTSNIIYATGYIVGSLFMGALFARLVNVIQTRTPVRSYFFQV